MQLTSQQKQQYLDEGYVVVRNLIPAAELMPLRERLSQLLHEQHDWPAELFHVLDKSRFRNENGGPIPLGLMKAAQQDENFQRVADHSNLQSVMKQLLGPTAHRSTDQAIFRAGSLNSGQSFYHQDSYYWRLEPEVGCNCWITLNEVDKNAGALAILPGSHQSWTLTDHEHYLDEPAMHSGSTGKVIERFRIPFEKVDFSSEVLLPMQPGDAAFFTNYTWHRAEPNGSGEDKFAYAPAYQREVS